MYCQTPRLVTYSKFFLLTLCLSACTAGQDNTGKKPAQMPPQSVGVIVAEVRRVPLQSELPGRTVAAMVAEIRPQISGIVRAREFTEGNMVAAGAPLYRIEDDRYRAAVSGARANVKRAEANREVARLKARRFQKLEGKAGVSRQARDDANAAYQLAQADVDAAKAVLFQRQIELDHTRITAPIAGRIGRSRVTVGALVTTAQGRPLATIQQIDPIHVDLTQSSRDLLALKKSIASGRLHRSDDAIPVQLLLEDGSVYDHPGKLAFSEASVDPVTGSVTLRAEFANPDGALLPGMYVRARLTEGELQQAVLVPHEALMRTPKGEALLMLVDDNNTVKPRVVTAKRSLGDQWLIIDGLKGGEHIIVEGLQKIRPGASVTPDILAEDTVSPQHAVGEAPQKQ